MTNGARVPRRRAFFLKSSLITMKDPTKCTSPETHLLDRNCLRLKGLEWLDKDKKAVIRNRRRRWRDTAGL
jgi:hypothetical protein